MRRAKWDTAVNLKPTDVVPSVSSSKNDLANPDKPSRCREPAPVGVQWYDAGFGPFPAAIALMIRALRVCSAPSLDNAECSADKTRDNGLESQFV
jgi:hypothetical protein